MKKSWLGLEHVYITTHGVCDPSAPECAISVPMTSRGKVGDHQASGMPMTPRLPRVFQD